MKPAALLAMTYPSVTQFETRHRLASAELERASAAGRHVERPRRALRRFRAVRGAAAA